MAAEPALLNGIKVLDLSTVGPGSRCAALLADLGAQVTKVQPPEGSGRITPPAYAYSAGRATTSVTLDLKHEEDHGRFLDLARHSDVVLESFRPGVATRLNVDFTAVRSVNPMVIYVSLTGYGRTGPRSAWAGHDLNYQAVTGALYLQGRRADGGPALPGATFADSAGGGMHAALSICAALVRRERTGTGADLDVAAVDGILSCMSLVIDEHLATDSAPSPGATLLTGQFACYDVYRCADDRWISVAAIEAKFFTNLCALLGLTEHAKRQYQPDAQEEIREDMRQVFATRPRDEWAARLASHDTCVAPVLDIPEVADHLREQARLVMVMTGDGRQFLQLEPVIAGSSTRQRSFQSTAGEDAT